MTLWLCSDLESIGTLGMLIWLQEPVRFFRAKSRLIVFFVPFQDVHIGISLIILSISESWTSSEKSNFEGKVQPSFAMSSDLLRTSWNFFDAAAAISRSCELVFATER